MPAAVTRPVLEEDDPVCLVEHERAGADDDGRPARARLAKAPRDPRLRVGVDRARGLDEDEDLRVGEQRPWQDDALALAARERAAALLDVAVEPVRQRLEHVLGVRDRDAPRGSPDRPTRLHGSSSCRSVPEKSSGSVSLTTIRRRTSSTGSSASGTPPRLTPSLSTNRPSRSASATASSGWSETSAVSTPGATTSPERASASSASAGGAAAGEEGSATSGSTARMSSIRRAPTSARVTLSTASAAVRSGITRKAA